MSNIAFRLRRCLVAGVAGLLAAATISTAATAETTPETGNTTSPGTSTPADEPETGSSNAPEQSEPAQDDPEQADPAPPDSSSATDPDATDSDATDSEATDSTDDNSADDNSDAAEPNSAEPDAAESATAQPSVAAAASGGFDPEGAMSAWTGGDGLIYFSGHAFDRDNIGATVTTMYTLNGNIVGYQAAQLRSADLDKFGLPYKGVFGAFQAPSAGPNTLCMFAFNIGGGSDKLVSCQNVNVPAKNPRGDIVVDVVGGQVRVNGWLFDESNPTQSLAMWIVDNGSIVSSFVANAPSPYLYSYGVGGNHAFGSQYTPAHSGSHNVCVYGINVGFGQSTWIECGTVVVDITADNPKGAFTLDVDDFDGNGFNDLFIDGWAYDPNDPTAAIDIAVMVDGQLVHGDTADWYSRHMTPPGVPGDHGFYAWLGEVGWELYSGAHNVCVYAYNIGPGTGQWIQCSTVYT